MGLWTTLYIAAAEDVHLSHADFSAMVLGAWSHGVITPPVTVMSGFLFAPKDGHRPIESTHVPVPAEIASFPIQLSVRYANYFEDTDEEIDETGEAAIWYQGDDGAALARALRDLPYGESDVCVDSWHTSGVRLYALTSPRPILVGDHIANQYTILTTSQFCIAGPQKGLIESMSRFPIKDALYDFYGPGLQTAREFS